MQMPEQNLEFIHKLLVFILYFYLENNEICFFENNYLFLKSLRKYKSWETNVISDKLIAIQFNTISLKIINQYVKQNKTNEYFTQIQFNVKSFQTQWMDCLANN